MAYAAFISYGYSDRVWLHTIKKWENERLLPQYVRITHEQTKYRREQNGTLRSEVQALIQRASIVLVLIGNNPHNRYWIHQEIAFALTKGKRIVVARIPKTTAKAPETIGDHQEILLRPGILRQEL